MDQVKKANQTLGSTLENAIWRSFIVIRSLVVWILEGREYPELTLPPHTARCHKEISGLMGELVLVLVVVSELVVVVMMMMMVVV